MSTELGEKLDKAYIAGLTAPVAVMENQHKALWLYPNFVNWDDQTFEKFPLTHALVGTDLSKEVNHYFSMWPKRMERARLLKVYPIKDYFLYLYSFIDPYISNIKMVESRQYQITIKNLSLKKTNTTIGMVYIRKASPKDLIAPEFSIKIIPKAYDLYPGNTDIYIPIDTKIKQNFDSVLIFLQADSPFGANTFRCEGENFPGKTGTNFRDNLSSKGQVRFFSQTQHKQGFLSYGPGVPFSSGFMIADFKLTFSNLKTKIKGLCLLELFSTEDGIALDEMIIKPGDIKRNKDNTYRLKALIPDTKKIEFRIQTKQLADLSFDYIDITYYQGQLLDLDKEPITQ
jgi:hypothetical protein